MLQLATLPLSTNSWIMALVHWRPAASTCLFFSVFVCVRICAHVHLCMGLLRIAGVQMYARCCVGVYGGKGRLFSLSLSLSLPPPNSLSPPPTSLSPPPSLSLSLACVCVSLCACACVFLSLSLSLSLFFIYLSKQALIFWIYFFLFATLCSVNLCLSPSFTPYY